MARALSGKEKHFYRVAAVRPVWDGSVTHTHFYGPYTEIGPAVAQGKRATSRSGGYSSSGRREPRVPLPGASYQVQRLTVGIGVWEVLKPATWEPVQG